MHLQKRTFGSFFVCWWQALGRMVWLLRDSRISERVMRVAATVLSASGKETSVQTPPGGMTMRSNGRPPAVFWFWAHAVVLSRRLDCGAGPSRCR